MQAPNISPLAPKTTISTAQQRRTCEKYSTAYIAQVSRKLRALLLWSFVFSLIIAIIAQFRIGYIRNIQFKSGCVTALVYAFILTVINGFILFTRFAYARLWKPIPPSAAAEFVYSITSKSNWLLFIFYAGASLASISLYFSYVLGLTYTKNFFQQPPGHYEGANQLNLENIFVKLFSILIALGFVIDFISRERYSVSVNRVQQPKFQDVKTSLSTIVSRSFYFSLKTFFVAYILFIFTKSTIYYSLAYISATWARVLDSPVVGFHWLDLYLFFRLIIAGTLTVTSWNITHRLFDVIFPEVVPITDPFANQYDCLIDGLSPSNKEIIRSAAFSELAKLCCQRPAKRVELFKYIKKDIHESAWYRIMIECTNVINELKQAIDEEYNGVKPVAAPAPVVKPNEPTAVNRIQLVQSPDIYVPRKQYEPYLDDRTGILFNHVSQTAYEHVPSPIPAVEKIVDRTRSQLLESQLIKLLKNIELKTGAEKWVCLRAIYANTVSRRVQSVFKKHQLVIWAIQSLGSLTAASLTEDQMGYVQYNIGTVLDTLLGLLEEVEKYTHQPPAQYKNLSFGVTDRILMEEPDAVVKALNEAVYQIAGAFSEYTDGFSVQRKYDQKWQSFLAYKE